ncbi:MAG: GtrA family protein [Roseburia sp.]|nr:GtrA family protein [Roseburia sp.]
MDKIKELMSKYEEIIVYLIVGVMTTIVSWVVVFIGKLFLDMNIPWQNFLNNTISWILSVLFSYPLNRKWVFKSRNPRVIRELAGFAASRLSTWAMDVVIMWLTVNVWNMHYWISKIFISAVLVTVANYMLSKLLIFRKKDETKSPELDISDTMH